MFNQVLLIIRIMTSNGQFWKKEDTVNCSYLYMTHIMPLFTLFEYCSVAKDLVATPM